AAAAQPEGAGEQVEGAGVVEGGVDQGRAAGRVDDDGAGVVDGVARIVGPGQAGALRDVEDGAVQVIEGAVVAGEEVAAGLAAPQGGAGVVDGPAVEGQVMGVAVGRPEDQAAVGVGAAVAGHGAVDPVDVAADVDGVGAGQGRAAQVDAGEADVAAGA